jgi:RHS repeat-associated protein
MQTHMRKRVSAVFYQEEYEAAIRDYETPTSTDEDFNYQHATHYSYDIHGNVKTLIQDFPGMGIPAPANSKKQIDYRYDLISGNVLQVSYQAGYLDQYYHRYEYDADNRITAVYTSDYGWEGATGALNLNMPEDMMFWEKDAVYRYYKHGPLAKVELGELGVQGVDYAYTLQGWLKGVNSTKLDEVNDMGKEGNMTINTPYQYFARDPFSYSLSYFQGDYAPIRGPQVGTATCWLSDNAGSFTQANRFDLWNGNIGSMATTLNTGGPTPTNLYQNMAYKYDQLNRLVNAVGQGNYNAQTNKWGSTADISNRYLNQFTYDPNGNILTQKRHDQAGVQFDDLRYRYNYNIEGRFIDNRLYHVSDNIAANAKTDDIDNQTGSVVFGPQVGAGYASELNYFYDELGQLIRDKQEKIENIIWRVDGKISYISRNNGSGKSELSFTYDAMGSRVEKTVNNDGGTWTETEYYVRDAQGNVMAIYKKYIRNNQLFYDLTEQHIYGSSRLGVDRRNVDVIAAGSPSDNVSLSVKRGEKHYELSNHLGNVLATVSDKKIAVMSGANLSYYRADVVSYSDYYPFGAPMTERTAVVTPTDVRYGFNGKEMDSEINGNGNAYDFGARMYDARLGRWFSLDILFFTSPSLSPYLFVANNPLVLIDPDGKKERPFEKGKSKPIVQVPNTATPIEYFNENGNRHLNANAFNCHSYAWHKSKGDSNDQIGSNYPELPRWDNNPADDIREQNAKQLHTDVRNKVGDIVIYYFDANSNGIYQEDESIAHSAIVSKVDKDGFTTEVTGKMGEAELATNHPGAPGYYETDNLMPDGNLLTRAYFRVDANIQKLGGIEFDSNLAKPVKDATGKTKYLIVQDLNTGKDYGVTRNDNGSYSFYDDTNEKK